MTLTFLRRLSLATTAAAVALSAQAAPSFSWLNPEAPVSDIITSSVLDNNQLYANPIELYRQGYAQIPLNFVLAEGPVTEEGVFFDYFRFVSNRNQAYYQSLASGKKKSAIPQKDWDKVYWTEIQTSCTKYPQNWSMKWDKIDQDLNKKIAEGKLTADDKNAAINQLNFLEFRLQLTCALAKSGYRTGTFGVWQELQRVNYSGYAQPLARKIVKGDEKALANATDMGSFLVDNEKFANSAAAKKLRTRYGNYAKALAEARKSITSRVFSQEKPYQAQQELFAKFTSKTRLQDIGITPPPKPKTPEELEAEKKAAEAKAGEEAKKAADAKATEAKAADADKKATDATKPATEADKKAADDAKPADTKAADADKKATDATKPATEADKKDADDKATDAAKPATDTKATDAVKQAVEDAVKQATGVATDAAKKATETATDAAKDATEAAKQAAEDAAKKATETATDAAKDAADATKPAEETKPAETTEPKK